MPYQGGWLNPEKTILTYSLNGRWTWEEATDMIRDQVAHLGSVDYKVHTIFDLRDGKSVPQQHGALQALRKIMLMTHPNEDLIILVGATGFLRALIDIITHAYRLGSYTLRYRYANTMEEALEIIKQYESEPAER